MKRIVTVLIIIFSSFSAFAQSDVKTDSFKVEGNCGMCKKRIEDAAYIRGVKRAEWNPETLQLTVTYKDSRTSMKNIAENVARAGHSSEKATASEKDYSRLPECCQYKTNVCTH